VVVELEVLEEKEGMHSEMMMVAWKQQLLELVEKVSLRVTILAVRPWFPLKRNESVPMPCPRLVPRSVV
jgi:hypothetical protein